MCKFCERGSTILSPFDDGCAYIEHTVHAMLLFDNSDGENGHGHIRINYCPLCGRRLEEQLNTDKS